MSYSPNSPQGAPNLTWRYCAGENGCKQLLRVEAKNCLYCQRTDIQPLNHRLASSLKIGNFDLIELLGDGGMGYVYRARHLTTKQEFALKIPKPEPEVVARFLGAELEVQQRLREVYGVDTPQFALANQAEPLTHDKVPYLVMRLLSGETLKNRALKTGKLSPTQIAEMMRQVAEALHKLHQVGFIHNDLKESNIFLHREGDKEWAVLIDFGAARVDSKSLTETGFFSGTLSRMPPEVDDLASMNSSELRSSQIKIDVLCDIYQLGLVAYWIAVGTLPSSKKDPKPLRELDPSIPAPFEEVILKCLKNREDRYTKAQCVVQAFQEVSVRLAAVTEANLKVQSIAQAFQGPPQEQQPVVDPSPKLLPAPSIKRPSAAFFILLPRFVLLLTILFLANNPISQKATESPSVTEKNSAKDGALDLSNLKTLGRRVLRGLVGQAVALAPSNTTPAAKLADLSGPEPEAVQDPPPPAIDPPGAKGGPAGAGVDKPKEAKPTTPALGKGPNPLKTLKEPPKTKGGAGVAPKKTPPTVPSNKNKKNDPKKPALDPKADDPKKSKPTPFQEDKACDNTKNKPITFQDHVVCAIQYCTKPLAKNYATSALNLAKKVGDDFQASCKDFTKKCPSILKIKAIGEQCSGKVTGTSSDTSNTGEVREP